MGRGDVRRKARTAPASPPPASPSRGWARRGARPNHLPLRSPKRGMSMTARLGLFGGLAAFAILLLLPAPAGMPSAAWRTVALVVLMAVWWMTQALPLTATALLPFLAFPLF